MEKEGRVRKGDKLVKEYEKRDKRKRECKNCTTERGHGK